MDMHDTRAVFAERRALRDQPAARVCHDPIVIGLVNNMPDAALRATERQFCALLSAASRDCVVRLKLFSLPEIPRAPAMRAHVARYYEDFSDLDGAALDGLIVTGSEPRTRRLEDEPHWPALCGLVDWAQESGVSSIWSCLAAHAAVLRLDGVERRAMGPKLSGVFDCRIDSAGHRIVRGTPDRWRVPHSRMYGLGEDALLRAGYQILSRSDEAGPDVFVRQGRGLSLFFQGHPEYGPSALLGEYRRDVARFLDGERDVYPERPQGCFGPHLASQLDHLRARAERAGSADGAGLREELTALLAGAPLASPWAPTAARLYTNWVSHLDEQRARAAAPPGAYVPAAMMPGAMMPGAMMPGAMMPGATMPASMMPAEMMERDAA